MRKALCLALFVGSAAAQQTGTIKNPDLEEISGLALSLADPQILWGHNDSGNAAVLFRIGLKGENLGTVALAGGSLVDWEDIAAFHWRGHPALLLADVGDNLAARNHATLYAVRDPVRGETTELLWSLDFRYPDGARDCEAVAVDMRGGDILLLSKRDHPPRLYRLALPAKPPALGPDLAQNIHTAEFLGEVRSIPPPAQEDRRRAGWLRSRWLDMPAALDISADGRRAVIVTAAYAYLYQKEPGQGWLQALNTVAHRLALPGFPQIEAGAFSADGRWLYIASEQQPMGFARIALPPP